MVRRTSFHRRKVQALRAAHRVQGRAARCWRLRLGRNVTRRSSREPWGVQRTRGLVEELAALELTEGLPPVGVESRLASAGLDPLALPWDAKVVDDVRLLLATRLAAPLVRRDPTRRVLAPVGGDGRVQLVHFLCVLVRPRREQTFKHAPPARIFPPLARHAVDSNRIPMQVAIFVDFEADEALKVGAADGGERFVPVQLQEVDAHEKVEAKDHRDHVRYNDGQVEKVARVVCDKVEPRQAAAPER
mmetsp:Transcript_10873/g.30854  ORF Transcript_10873/g.30854 Transcript_10873/m.30854 type:complete len:246 (-) Transcript_10873:253-990(-)